MLCRNYAQNGICPYAQRCQFIHKSPTKPYLGPPIVSFNQTMYPACFAIPNTTMPISYSTESRSTNKLNILSPITRAARAPFHYSPRPTTQFCPNMPMRNGGINATCRPFAASAAPDFNIDDFSDFLSLLRTTP